MNSVIRLLILISAVGLFSCSNGNSDKKKDETTSDLTVVQSNGVTIDYNSYGEGDYTLLFAHGWCIDQTYWSNQVDAFKQDYRVITMDLSGFGQSGKDSTNWTIQGFGADINALISQLELSNVILIGHSMSGDVILEAASKNKDILALIGVDNFKDVGVEMTPEIQAEIDGFINMLENDFTEVAPAYADGYLFHDDTDSLVRNLVKQNFIQCDPTIAVQSLKSLFDNADNLNQQLSNLDRKLYLINSDSSPTLLEGLDKTGVAYEILEVKSAGHYPMVERPEEFNNRLDEALERIKDSHSEN